MEKEKLLSSLTEKLGKTNFSSETLSTYVDGILPTILKDEDVNDDFYSRHVKFIQSMDGQYNRDMAQSTRAMKEEWEKSHKDDHKEDHKNDHKDDPYEELRKKVEELEKKSAESQKKSIDDGIRKEAQARAAELKVSNKNLWNDAVLSVEFEDGFGLDDVVDKAKKVYESKLKAYMGEGAVPYGGTKTPNGPDEETANARRAAFKEKMRSRGRLPKAE